MLSLSPEDCAMFYDQNLKPLSVNGELVNKKSFPDYNLLTVKNKEGGTITIKLLKTNVGIKLYMFAKEKSLIIKKKGENIIHVAVPLPNGGIQVQVFPNLCD